MGNRIPRHRDEGCFEAFTDLEWLKQTSICPLSDAVVCPQENVRTFAALSSGLKFLGDLLLGFDLHRHPHLLFKFLAELHPRAEASIIAQPNDQLTLSP
jgi:hypothetical protein